MLLCVVDSVVEGGLLAQWEPTCFRWGGGCPRFRYSLRQATGILSSGATSDAPKTAKTDIMVKIQSARISA